MNLRELVAKLKLESPRQGPAPASISTSTKDDARLWGWVQDAWLSLETGGILWKFLRKTLPIAITAGKAEYTPTEMGMAAGVQKLWPCDDYYRPVMSGAGIASYFMQKQVDANALSRTLALGGEAPGLPQYYAWSDAGTLLLSPVPDRDLTLTIDVVRGNVPMADEGTPPLGLPTAHHNLLVWDALKRLAIHDASSEQLARANIEYSQAWDRLWSDQGPTISMERRAP